jgi:hypothetical protein
MWMQRTKKKFVFLSSTGFVWEYECVRVKPKRKKKKKTRGVLTWQIVP